MRTVLKGLGMTLVYWSNDADDQVSTTVNATFAQWIAAPHAGLITLQHDLFANAAPQIPPVVDQILKSGATIKTIMNCTSRGGAYTKFPDMPALVGRYIPTGSASTLQGSNPPLTPGTAAAGSTAKSSGFKIFNSIGLLLLMVGLGMTL